MNSKQKVLAYIAGLAVIVSLLIIIEFLRIRMEFVFSTTYIYPMTLNIIKSLVVIVLGAAVSVICSYIKTDAKSCLKFKADIPRLLILALPLFLLSFVQVVLFQYPAELLRPHYNFYAYSAVFAQLILGFILPSCFFKKESV
ncbi:MAG: hypothetical protein IJC41_00240 [Firmicutes bacterium]|nr:hypothetical protein [Bacillota bacterium]